MRVGSVALNVALDDSSRGISPGPCRPITWLTVPSVLALLLIVSACVDPKVPNYTLTAPSQAPAITPTPPVPPVLATLTVDLSIGPSSPRINRTAALVANTRNLQGTGSYVWSFGDGATLVTTTDSARHVYRTPGLLTASVRVTETSGRTAESAIQVTIRDEPEDPAPPPTADPGPPTLSAVITCTPGTTSTLTTCNVTASFGGAPVSGGSIRNVWWDWADGTLHNNQSLGPVNAHQYTTPGSYTIVVEVTADVDPAPGDDHEKRHVTTVSHVLKIP